MTYALTYEEYLCSSVWGCFAWPIIIVVIIVLCIISAKQRRGQ